MNLNEDYNLEELETAVEGLNHPLSSAVKNPEIYRNGTEALESKIGTYTSRDLQRILNDSEASQQQLGFFSSAMEELGFVFEGDPSSLDREYGRPANTWRNYRDESFWEGLKEDLDSLYSETIEPIVLKQ